MPMPSPSPRGSGKNAGRSLGRGGTRKECRSQTANETDRGTRELTASTSVCCDTAQPGDVRQPSSRTVSFYTHNTHHVINITPHGVSCMSLLPGSGVG